jgi:hypothetical protein
LFTGEDLYGNHLEELKVLSAQLFEELDKLKRPEPPVDSGGSDDEVFEDKDSECLQRSKKRNRDTEPSLDAPQKFSRSSTG